MKIKVTNNFDKVAKDLEKKAKAINGPVSFATLFNSSFMAKYTNLKAFEELLSLGGYIVNSKEDFEAIPEDEFDKLISENTKFSSWEEMYTKAAEEYVVSKLNL